jgi:hypothetical protein
MILLSPLEKSQDFLQYKLKVKCLSCRLGEASGSKTASVSWFSKVLKRLRLLCVRAYGDEPHSSLSPPGVASPGKTLMFDRRRPLFACLDAPSFAPDCSSSQADAKLPPSFVASLTPLLTTIGAEMAGADNTVYLDKAEAACCVAELLSLVLTDERAAQVLKVCVNWTVSLPRYMS